MDTALKYGLDHLMGGFRNGIRVYVKGLDNIVREHGYDGEGWFIGGFPETYCSDHAAAAYVKKESGHDKFDLRVYTVDMLGNLTETCWDGSKWYKGDLALTDVEAVTATAWVSGTNVLLLGEGTDATHVRVVGGWHLHAGMMQQHSVSSACGRGIGERERRRPRVHACPEVGSGKAAGWKSKVATGPQPSRQMTSSSLSTLQAPRSPRAPSTSRPLPCCHA